MNVDIQTLKNEIEAKLQSVHTEDDLEKIRVDYLGKKGRFRVLTEGLKNIPDAERPDFGRQVNELKQFAEASFQAKLLALSPVPVQESSFDQTLPSIQPLYGRVHPISQTIEEITRLFERLGFETVHGPEIETEFYNFTALNIPLDHPSRDGFDTFYTPAGQLLRSQTSTVQIRVMQSRKPPLRIIAPGRVYRPDAVDASHSFMFHQIEGLMVDEKTSFSDLKGILHLFLRELFGKDVKIRFRPHFFPFTEPSVEADIRWGKGWLEILGAGMVDPNVFESVGYDAKRYQGFAFGLGVERIAMLRHDIRDIRMFTENDLRFLRQF